MEDLHKEVKEILKDNPKALELVDKLVEYSLYSKINSSYNTRIKDLTEKSSKEAMSNLVSGKVL